MGLYELANRGSSSDSLRSTQIIPCFHFAVNTPNLRQPLKMVVTNVLHTVLITLLIILGSILSIPGTLQLLILFMAEVISAYVNGGSSLMAKGTCVIFLMSRCHVVSVSSSSSVTKFFNRASLESLQPSVKEDLCFNCIVLIALSTIKVWDSNSLTKLQESVRYALVTKYLQLACLPLLGMSDTFFWLFGVPLEAF